MKGQVIMGDCLEVLRGLPDNSVDSVVTDPPYGLSKEPNITEVLTKWIAGEPYDHGHGGFMGKAWDSFVPHPDVWKEVFRVLKPGGHALVFAGTRTQDLMTIALRLGGFEIRDVIEWLYFSGFPKSMDVGKSFDKRAGADREVIGKRLSAGGRTGKNPYQSEDENFNMDGKEIDITAPATDLARRWDGWGTALKPAHEPIIVARKPFAGTVAANVEQYGTGAINIDASRIPTDEVKEKTSIKPKRESTGIYGDYNETIRFNGNGTAHQDGRFPANCITTDDDAFCSPYFNVTPREVCKKASKTDRNADWEGEEITLPESESKKFSGGNFAKNGDGTPRDRNGGMLKNTHPTVKPTDLMAWLVRLVTPPGGTVLDPFAGSGSTLVAAKREGFGFIGIEREPEYVEIINSRVGM